MFWPRLQLTPDEAKRWAPYTEPGKTQRPVFYRAYAAELSFSNTSTEDVDSVSISKRSRVMGMTASGDIHNVEIEISDTSGERYSMGFIPLANMLCGTNSDPRGLYALLGASGHGFPVGNLLPGACLAPHIFEPNVLLAPNQTLSVKGRLLRPLATLAQFNPANVAELPRQEAMFVNLVFHVWEFNLE